MRRGDELVRLTERERDILRALGRDAGGQRLARDAGRAGRGGQERAIDVQITRLRRKIEPDPANPVYLQTARGAGYRLVADT